MTEPDNQNRTTANQADDLPAAGHRASNPEVPELPTGANIGTGSPPLKSIAYIFAIICMLVLFAVVTKYVTVDCNNYFMMLLVYPLLFGIAGVVLGGAIVLTGTINIAGVPLDAKMMGGIAAAVLGLGIAWFARPVCAEMVYDFDLKDLPLGQPTADVDVRRFLTVSADPNLHVQVTASQDSKYKVSFKFATNEESKVILRAYEKEVQGRGYGYRGSCEIRFVPTESIEPASEKLSVLKLKPESSSLSFNPQYFTRLHEAGDTEANLCLQGMFAGSDGNYQQEFVVPPLKYTPQKHEVFFTKEKPKQPSTTREAIIQAAQSDLKLSTEALTSTGTGEAAPSTLPKKPIEVTASNINPPPGCQISDTELKANVDRFLTGDDLDRDTRRAVYAKWPLVNCYVVSVAFQPTESGKPQQSRALKLLGNAIMNNSTMKDMPLYWQPAGDIRRDFRHTLPFISAANTVAIIDFLASDNPGLRAEAVRFVKAFPVDAFDQQFKKKAATLPASTAVRERYAIAANSFYYNRITEWLNGQSPDINAARKVVEIDFAQGRSWANDAFFDSKNAKSYEAMLYYARGIVEHELHLTDDQGKSSFEQMLKLLKAANGVYPSRYVHIAQAVAISAAAPAAATSDMLKQIRQADQLPAATVLDGNLRFTDPSYQLYVGPSKAVSIPTKVSNKDPARLLLKQGDWYFLNAKDKFGWVTTTH